MRITVFLALMALMSVSLSGCLGFGDDADDDEHEDDGHEHDCDADHGTEGLDCDNETHGAENGTAGNETQEPAVPNVLPEAVLTMTADDGTVLNETSYILPGQNITFSAAGSSDADGEVALVGLTVTDANGTRTAQLFDADAGAFVDATMTFDRVGPINVTVRVLDDDGEGVIRTATAAVNAVSSQSDDFSGAVPGGSPDSCSAPGESDGVPLLITNNYAKAFSFGVAEGAQWISAKVTGGDAEIAICSPDGEALSDAGTEVETEDGNGTLPVNAQYDIMVYSHSPNQSVTVEIMVHYETKP